MSTYGGDSYEGENQIRRRRVNDLLTEDVPLEEAVKTANGKYKCIICPQQPIIDTTAMLGIHRGGKKHQEYYNIFKQRNVELQQEKEKRQALQTNTQPTIRPAPKPLPAAQAMLFSVMSESNIPYNSMAYQYNPEQTSATSQAKAKNKPEYVFPEYFTHKEKKKRKKIGPQLESDPSLDAKRTKNGELIDKSDPDYKEKMFLAGWRWNSKGNMYKVQDPTVEFDSDEEQEVEEIKNPKQHPTENTSYSETTEPTTMTTNTRKPISIDLTKPKPHIKTETYISPSHEFKSSLPKISPFLPPSSIVQKPPVRYQTPTDFYNDIPAPPPRPIPQFIPPPPK